MEAGVFEAHNRWMRHGRDKLHLAQAALVLGLRSGAAVHRFSRHLVTVDVESLRAVDRTERARRDEFHELVAPADHGAELYASGHARRTARLLDGTRRVVGERAPGWCVLRRVGRRLFL